MANPSNRHLVSAAMLTRDEIRNYQDEPLGKAHEIVIDCDAGRVAYVVMSSGTSLGLGNRLFAIPSSALQLDWRGKCLRLDASKKAFANAQALPREHWPARANLGWTPPSAQGHFCSPPPCG